MFARAVSIAREFTRPVVASVLLPDQTLGSGVSAFIVVNKDGWILTANHVVKQYQELTEAKNLHDDYTLVRDSVLNDKSLLPDQKQKKLKKLGARNPPDGSIADFGIWWGDNSSKFVEAHAIDDADLALCKLDNFDPSSITSYPIFKDPSKGIDPGTSLCRLGFPFTEAKQAYNAGKFTVDASGMVFFPNDGIFTRTITHSTGPLVASIETSTPGLRGQSGGPIFDAQGRVWGIQTKTGHLALGFSPPVPNGKPGEVEHQFLNVGRGAHPETLVNLLRDKGVDFQISAD